MSEGVFYEFSAKEKENSQRVWLEVTLDRDYWNERGTHGEQGDHKGFLKALFAKMPFLREWALLEVSDCNESYVYERDPNGNYEVYKHWAYIEDVSE